MLEVQCECGAKFSLQEDMLGKRIRCPKCSAVISVQDNEDVFDDDEASEPEFEAISSPEPRRSSKGRRRSKKGSASESDRKKMPALGDLSGNLLHQNAGTACLLVGFLMIVGSRGCSQTTILNLGRLEAKATAISTDFRNEWDTKQQLVADQIADLREELSEEDDVERMKDIRDQIDDFNEKLEKLSEDRAEAQKKLEREELRDLRRSVSSARNNIASWSFWLEIPFVLGTLVLVYGLLAVGLRGSPHERIPCLVILAIITFSIFIGGSAWLTGALGRVMGLVRELT